MCDIIKYEFNISFEYKDLRLDQAIAQLIPEINRAQAQKLISASKVFVNDKIVARKNFKLSGGDNLVVLYEKESELRAFPQDIPLDIVYEDDDVLIVNKPAGLVVHPSEGTPSGTLVNGLLFYLGDNISHINGDLRPGIVHRIDKDTSGLLVIAKNDYAHERLAEQFYVHSINRKYLAIVIGRVGVDEGTVDVPIGRDLINRLRRKVNGTAARNAVTHFRVLERFRDNSYVECTLETGRTHQIRVHMAYIHHPLLGDKTYGARKDRKNADGQFLHAKLLGFAHPRTNKYMEFTALPPENFQKKLEYLRKQK